MNRKSVIYLLTSLLLGTTFLPAQQLNRKPIRVFGHARNIATSGDPLAIDTTSPNLVEGREMFSPQGIAVDTTVTPPILYVSDTGNNRVLAWRDGTGFAVGAPADLVIGQRDRYTTLRSGPGSAFSTGLDAPTGLAVDRNGSLFVVDTGNNRILRYRRPFDQPSGAVNPESVIGQANFGNATFNAGGISEKTLATNVGGNIGVLKAGLAFDRDGNLWTTDPGNNRVLRYPAGTLTLNQPSADLVLGQQTFIGRGATTVRTDRAFLNQPSSIAVDSGGRVFVTDDLNRVLVFVPFYANGATAARLMGGQTNPILPNFNEMTLGARSGSQNFPPQGVFMVGDRPAVIDTFLHRILIYEPYPSWQPESVQFSPPATTVLGQPNFNAFLPHRGGKEPSNISFLEPSAAVATATELFVADSRNSRVIVMPATGSSFGPAVRLLGQFAYNLNSINFIEGREFFAPTAMVIDKTVRPNRLYVADTSNNRVLGYRDYLKYKTGDKADIVIGQPDFFTARVNHPSIDPVLPTDTGLNSPQGLAVDAAGNLWVADTLNGRVVRFPKPFDQAAGGTQRADLVLGQTSLTTQVRDPGQRTMRSPIGIAFSVEGGDPNSTSGVLAVVDSDLNRVLIFNKPFTSGMAASRVLGQPDFTSSAAAADSNRMSAPRHAATDTDDRLYVADPGNQRVLIFDNVTRVQDQAIPGVILRNTIGTGRLNRPVSVSVSSQTGEIWVADSGANLILRYPRFDQLALANFLANFSMTSARPLGILTDPYTNVLVADSYNRIGYFAPEVAIVNAANYFTRGVAPGTIISIFPSQPTVFGAETPPQSFDMLPNPIPLPRELSDLQVLVRTAPLSEPTPVPIFYASAQQINAPLPMGLPESGRVELQVVRPSTGQIFGVSDMLMAPSSPAFFTAGATGSGQIAALNQDGSVNSAATPIA
jgi:sugar lactone lactonase YvrE